MLNKLQDKKTLNKKGIQANLMKLDSGLDHFLSNHKSISCVVVKDLRKRRSKAIVGMTLNKMGIIVPYDKKTELGYRSLPLTKSKGSCCYYSSSWQWEDWFRAWACVM